MIVDARAAGSIVSRLLGPATAGAVQQEHSFWRGTLGKPMVSKQLTIVDDPRSRAASARGRSTVRASPLASSR